MTGNAFELSPRPAVDDVPTFLQTCHDLGGYPEPPAWIASMLDDNGGTLQNLARWAHESGGEG